MEKLIDHVRIHLSQKTGWGRNEFLTFVCDALRVHCIGLNLQPGQDLRYRALYVRLKRMLERKTSWGKNELYCAFLECTAIAMTMPH
jgi:hypothetical protein